MRPVPYPSTQRPIKKSCCFIPSRGSAHPSRGVCMLGESEETMYRLISYTRSTDFIHSCICAQMPSLTSTFLKPHVANAKHTTALREILVTGHSSSSDSATSTHAADKQPHATSCASHTRDRHEGDLIGARNVSIASFLSVMLGSAFFLQLTTSAKPRDEHAAGS